MPRPGGYIGLGRLLCAAVIGFQISFPLFLVLPYPFALAYPIAGFLFHIAISYFMRLNLFVFTFISNIRVWS